MPLCCPGTPGDVSGDERSLVAPHLTPVREDAPQREHSLREVFNGLRCIVRAGMQRRMMPRALPPVLSPNLRRSVNSRGLLVPLAIAFYLDLWYPIFVDRYSRLSYVP